MALNLLRLRAFGASRSSFSLLRLGSSSSSSAALPSSVFSQTRSFSSPSAPSSSSPQEPQEEVYMDAAAVARLEARRQEEQRKALGIPLTGSQAVRRLKATSPGQRGTVLIDRSHLWRGRPIKSLTEPQYSKAGKGSGGRTSTRHRGGGHKQRYRLVDFKREHLDQIGIVKRFEYDPNRSAHLALIHYPSTGKMAYIVAPQDLQNGDLVQASRSKALDIKPGFAMPLRMIPIGTVVHMVEIQPGHGAQMVRAAGTFAQVLEKDSENKRGFALLRLSSKEVRFVHLDCLATVGVVSNPLHKLRKLGKAGRARWLGRRPHTRGVAMNPVDHPHGGRENKGRPGRPSVSFSGILAKGFKTRKRPRNPLVVVPAGGAKKGSVIV